MSLPPLDWWPLAWIAPIPWVLLIRREELGGRRPYLTLYAAGFLFWMGALHWLRLPHWATSIGWVALSLYFAFYLPLFVGLSRVAVHRLRIPVILAVPAVWTGLELLRAHLLTGMSMGNISHTQYRWIALIQLSDLAGEYGVSFVVMFVAASLARMFPCESPLSLWERARVRAAAFGEKSPSTGKTSAENMDMSPSAPRIETDPFSSRLAFWPLLPAAAMMAAVLIYGQGRIDMNSTKAGPRIALIQGSIDLELDSDPEIKDRIITEYFNLSCEAVEKNRRLDLVVWPESMFFQPLVTFDPDAVRPPDYEGTEAEFFKDLKKVAESNAELRKDIAQQLGTPLLMGTNYHHFGVQGERAYSSSIYVGRDGRLLGRYDKCHLVMFGEYMPFIEYFPWLQNFTPLTGSASPGEKFMAFDVAGTCVAPSICYENVLPHVIRRQVNVLAAEGKEPDVLVNLTNDGWFWGSSELDMHLACGVFRAVECRKPLLIAANTGFSAWIDSDGRIGQQGPRRAKQVLIAEPRLDEHRRSWYLEQGDWFAGTCLLLCGILGIAGLYPLRRVFIKQS
jgi:apolipoprotein N-acyltransferase